MKNWMENDIGSNDTTVTTFSQLVSAVGFAKQIYFNQTHQPTTQPIPSHNINENPSNQNEWKR